MRRAWLLLGFSVIAVTSPARAEDPPDPAAAAAALETDDPGFGPLVEIERIDIVGNTRTAGKLIRRALAIKEGDRLHTGDPAFRVSRFRVLALGYFVDVQILLARGSERGKIVLTVEVVERGTFVLNRIFLGGSEATPVWAGLDLGDSNLLGTGVSVSAAAVWADRADLAGAREQVSARLRAADPSVLGGPLGVHGTALWVKASEPIAATASAFDYDRVGGIAGVSWELTRLSTLILDARLERVSAAGVYTWLPTAAVGFERDTRPDPVLPWAGDRALLVVEASRGDYDYVKAQASYARWFGVRGAIDVVSIHVGGGAIIGTPPFFEKFYRGDWNALLPPRALDLAVSTREPPDFLGTGFSADPYGDLAGSVEIEYTHRLFRARTRIYGGDLFVRGGAVTVANRDDNAPFYVDLTANAGLRVDTEIGVFELSLGNAIGRIPF